jgi:hypothetical protein
VSHPGTELIYGQDLPQVTALGGIAHCCHKTGTRSRGEAKHCIGVFDAGGTFEFWQRQRSIFLCVGFTAYCRRASTTRLDVRFMSLTFIKRELPAAPGCCARRRAGFMSVYTVLSAAYLAWLRTLLRERAVDAAAALSAQRKQLSAVHENCGAELLLRRSLAVQLPSRGKTRARSGGRCAAWRGGRLRRAG